jgi:hypothetical protein
MNEYTGLDKDPEVSKFIGRLMGEYKKKLNYERLKAGLQ